MWPHDKSIAWLLGSCSFIICQHPAKFGDYRWCGFGYTFLFICHMVSRDGVIKGSYNNYIVKFDCYSPPGSRCIGFYLSLLSLIMSYHTVKFDGCGGCRCGFVIVSIHQVTALEPRVIMWLFCRSPIIMSHHFIIFGG